MLQGADEVEHAVPGRLPASERAVAEDPVAGARGQGGAGAGDSVAQRGQHRDDLERRTRRIDALQRAVEQRIQIAARELLPARHRKARRELVRIERRAAHHAENAAVAWIDRDRTAPLHAGHRLFQRALHLEVEREAQVVTGFRPERRALAQRRHPLAHRVDHDVLGAVAPAQGLFVAPLDSGAPDQVPGSIALKLQGIQLGGVDLAGVAQQVRREGPVRVVAERLDLHFDSGQLGAPLLHRRDHRRRRIAAQRCVLTAAVGHLHPGPHFGAVELDHLGDPRDPARALGEARRRDALARERTEHDVEARRAVREQLSPSIVDRAARSAQHLEPDPVLLGELHVLIVLEHLEAKQSRDHEPESEHDHPGEQRVTRFPSSTNLIRGQHVRTGVDR